MAKKSKKEKLVYLDLENKSVKLVQTLIKSVVISK